MATLSELSTRLDAAGGTLTAWTVPAKSVVSVETARLDVYYSDGTHDTAFGTADSLTHFLDSLARSARSHKVTHHTLSKTGN